MTAVVLDAREYKILLDRKAFATKPALDTANAFWRDRIAPVIKASAGRGAALGKSRAAAAFEKSTRRTVQFWDTGDGLLAHSSFSLRQRDEFDADSGDIASTEISLKLRTADLFVAAATDLRGSQSGKKTKSKLEEDIAPLAVQASAKRGKSHVSQSSQASMRSRFSRSTKQRGPVPRKLGEVLKLYPTLENNLRLAGGKLPARSARMVPGVEVHEFVFETAGIDLGDDLECEFAMTYWYFGAATKLPGSVEISFKYELSGGEVALLPARRAYDLFVALQVGLGKLMDTEETSKTALVLPKRVGTP